MRVDYQLLSSDKVRAAQAFELRCRGASLTLEQWEARLMAPSTLAGMAVDAVAHGHPMVGFCVCRVSPLRRIWVESILVDPAHRRKGIGRGFLRKLVHMAADTGGASLQATVEDCNLGAHLWFKACGWFCEEVLRNHFGPGRDGYSFVRDAACAGKGKRRGKRKGIA